MLQKELVLFFGGLALFIGGNHLVLQYAPAGTDIALFDGLRQYTFIYYYLRFLISGVRKKINVYDAFIEGAKEGFKTAITIIPYLIAILVGIVYSVPPERWTS
jgi:hypothetical protein